MVMLGNAIDKIYRQAELSLRGQRALATDKDSLLVAAGASSVRDVSSVLDWTLLGVGLCICDAHRGQIVEPAAMS
jgi:hypothetical protein